MNVSVLIALINSGFLLIGGVLVAVLNRQGEERASSSRDFVHGQFSANGGASMRDAIDRIDSRSEMMERKMMSVDARLDANYKWHRDADKRIHKIQASIEAVNETVSVGAHTVVEVANQVANKVVDKVAEVVEVVSTGIVTGEIPTTNKDGS